MTEVRKENRFILRGVQAYAQNLSLQKDTLIRSLTFWGGVKPQILIKLTVFYARSTAAHSQRLSPGGEKRVDNDGLHDKNRIRVLAKDM